MTRDTDSPFDETFSSLIAMRAIPSVFGSNTSHGSATLRLHWGNIVLPPFTGVPSKTQVF